MLTEGQASWLSVAPLQMPTHHAIALCHGLSCMSLARAGVSLHARAAEAVSALPPDLAPDSQIAHGQKWGAIAERWGSKGKGAG